MKKQVGEVWVDSGQIMIVDPCYIGDDWDSEYESKVEYDGSGSPSFSYSGACAASHNGNAPPGKAFSEANFQMQNGAICTSSGFGDGCYPVYVEVGDYGEWGNRIKSITIDFDPQDEEVYEY
jgi:hypothetical protein